MNQSIINKISLRDSVGVLGLGACGGNIAYEFEKLNYTCFHVNTSLEDLTSLKDIKYYFHLKGEGGAFKNRDKAKEILRNSLPSLLPDLQAKLTQPIIIVTFGMAGGTGSGIAPIMCDILANQFGKTVIPCGVLPDEGKERALGCNNTIQCFSELENVSRLGATFLLDNKCGKPLATINKEFVSNMDAFLSIVHSSKQGNLDIGEKKFLLSQGGYAMLSKISQEKTSAINIINSFKMNIYAPKENDRIIRYLGVSLAKNNIDMKEVFTETGTPISDFVGYGSNCTSIFAVGMSYPSTRLMEIQDSVKNELPNIEKNMSANSTPLFSGTVDLLGGLMKPKTSTMDTVQPTVDNPLTQLNQSQYNQSTHPSNQNGATTVSQDLMAKYFG